MFPKEFTYHEEEATHQDEETKMSLKDFAKKIKAGKHEDYDPDDQEHFTVHDMPSVGKVCHG